MGIQILETTENLDKKTPETNEKEVRKKRYDFGTITVYRHGEVQVIKL